MAHQCQLCSNWEPSSGPFKFRVIPLTTLVGQDQAGSNVYPNNLAAGLTSFGIWKDEKKIHLAAAALQGLNIGAVWRHRALPGLTSTIQCTLGFQMENFATSGAGDIRNIPNIHSIVLVYSGRSLARRCDGVTMSRWWLVSLIGPRGPIILML